MNWLGSIEVGAVVCVGGRGLGDCGTEVEFFSGHLVESRRGALSLLAALVSGLLGGVLQVGKCGGEGIDDI